MARRHLVVLGASVVAVAAIVVATFGFATHTGGEPARLAPRVDHTPTKSSKVVTGAERRRAVSPPKLVQPSVEPARRVPDEASIMTELRTLAQSNPVRSLELVRVGDRRYPGSEDAPERAWFKIRSLVNLGRFDEAREAALVMVDTYRDTPWAGDVERHLLTQPLDHPSQRGNLAE